MNCRPSRPSRCWQGAANGGRERLQKGFNPYRRNLYSEYAIEPNFDGTA